MGKLVRDRIPEIIRRNGEIPVCRTLDEAEFRVEVMKKLLEEAKEVAEAKNPRDIGRELADLLEVMKAVAYANNIRWSRVSFNQFLAARDKGVFDEMVFLDRVEPKRVI
jgi:predicted house-cleaning noncanonical NTP pyrophosphatase (MazG superfamily)